MFQEMLLILQGKVPRSCAKMTGYNRYCLEQYIDLFAVPGQAMITCANLQQGRVPTYNRGVPTNNRPVCFTKTPFLCIIMPLRHCKAGIS